MPFYLSADVLFSVANSAIVSCHANVFNAHNNHGKSGGMAVSAAIDFGVAARMAISDVINVKQPAA